MTRLAAFICAFGAGFMLCVAFVQESAWTGVIALGVALVGAVFMAFAADTTEAG